VSALVTLPAGFTTRGAIKRALTHLERLFDDVGLLEHADHAEPRREHGYCVDDNARAVIVTERELASSASRPEVFDRCLQFVLAAQAADGRFRNRLSYGERRWQDAPGTGDHWGRALWALGRVAAHRAAHPLGERARAAFLAGARHRSPHPRAMAYAALGAAEMLAGAPTAQEATIASGLLADAVSTIGDRRDDAAWPWPAARLTYANARLPEALIAAGTELRDAAALTDGLLLLRWLADVETRGAHMSFTPVGGWTQGEPRPAFDQQPIEGWSMAAAASRALRATGDPEWRTLVQRCLAWFAGRNDTGMPLSAEESGGGCDGLTADGRNENQGAESTLAWIATLQHAERTRG
jgi:hypothetical protein